MKKKTVKLIWFVGLSVLTLSVMWIGAWFVGSAPSSPNAWAMFPVAMTSLLLMMATVIAGCIYEDH